MFKYILINFCEIGIRNLNNSYQIHTSGKANMQIKTTETVEGWASWKHVGSRHGQCRNGFKVLPEQVGCFVDFYRLHKFGKSRQS